MLSVGSLFSGIGGIELGFERAGGFRTEWFVECDKYAQAVLRKHWPSTPIYGDITRVDWKAVKPVDVLTGGFPCQDISNAGKRAGITGKRSGLWKEYIKAIRVLRPKYAVIENVSALTTRGLDVVLSDLAEAGYDAEWEDIRASDVGAPHRRERIFVVAYSKHYGYSKKKQRVVFEEAGVEKQDRSQDSSSWKPNRASIVGESDRLEKVPNMAYADIGRLEGSEEEGWNGADAFGSDRGRSQTTNVPNSDKGRLSETRTEQQTTRFTRSNIQADVPNTCEQGLEGEMQEELQEPKTEREPSRCSLSEWWSVEPDVGRVAYGVSFRVDRIKCLGNAVVPQVAQVVAEKVKRLERGEMK